MAKRKVDVCDNVKDLEHKKFRINEENENCVEVAVTDKDVFERLPVLPTSGVEWDWITASYPDQLTEIYNYYNGTGDETGELVLTVTVTYNDIEKCELNTLGYTKP